MPIHFEDLDMSSELAGLQSALIVPCNLCPAATVSVRQKKPFMKLFRSLIKSAPFEDYIEALQARLRKEGVRTSVFRSILYHHWFMCMWTSRRRKKLQKKVRGYDAVIVLGCESATETVRELVKAPDVKVIEGMKVTGIMNAKLSLQLPGSLVFTECKVVPVSQQNVV